MVVAAAVAKVAAAEKVALVAVGVPGKAEVGLAKVVLVAARALVRLVAGQAPLAILLAAAGEMHLPPRHKCN
ncbi:hypothetical protein [Propionivibrio sp.]|uniref:hypothetical protein n=1 Tax=Propionivibrio sp. TaxID=2212460 RepID=UPI003BF33DF1